MPEGAITEYVDVAQLCLYGFWLFFFALVFYLRREDRREGYPTEDDRSGRVKKAGPIFIPPPKQYPLMAGGVKLAPDLRRDEREHAIERVAPWGGAPYEPVGDPMLSGVGAAAWAERKDEVEITRAGLPAVVPTRVAVGFGVAPNDIDPRGLVVTGADGVAVGPVVDFWVDRAEAVLRYLEVSLPAPLDRTVLVPMSAARVRRNPDSIHVKSLTSAQFAAVPALKNPDQVTVLEEEKVMAYYAGGRLYAEPSRLGPVV